MKHRSIKALVVPYNSDILIAVYLLSAVECSSMYTVIALSEDPVCA
jgi:hypothetical protein